MGFRENLKDRLNGSDILVKELAARTGIKKATLDSYLRVNGYTPSVESGVKIAQALGVTAEYLVTGKSGKFRAPLPPSYSPETRQISALIEELDKKDRYRVLEIVRVFKRTGNRQNPHNQRELRQG